MDFFNHTNKELLEAEFKNNNITDYSIINSNIDELICNGQVWIRTTINDSNCNESVFNTIKFSDCTFFRSSMINSKFTNCSFLQSKFSGISLIKIHFENTRLKEHLFDSCTMQRAIFKKVIFENSTMKDFEAVYADLSNTIFVNCNLELNYGSGANGFSGSKLEDCLFINCNFTGYPLRGSNLINCTFSNCNGEITDDAVSKNSSGLSLFPSSNSKVLQNIEQATHLINEVKNV